MMFTADATSRSASKAKSKAETNTDNNKIRNHHGKEQDPRHELLQCLKRNDPTLTSLRILNPNSRIKNKKKKKGQQQHQQQYHPRETLEDWQCLGDAIATNTNLRQLDLLYPSQSSSSSYYPNQNENKGLHEFYAKLKNNTSIRRLTLHDQVLFDGVGEIHHNILLSQILENKHNLTSLSVTSSRSRSVTNDYHHHHHRVAVDSTTAATTTTSVLFSSALTSKKKQTSLKYLDLSNVGINDQACREIFTAVNFGHHFPTLRSLELNRNSIQSSGCVALATSLLNHPNNSMLIRLFLDENSINDEGAMALANGLVGNTRLKTLSIRENSAITSRGYEAFSKVLCNIPDVRDILRSNHTLERLGVDCCSQLSVELQYSLRFNRASNNKRRVANRKVVMHHLVADCNNSNLDLFATVPGGLLPNVLAMIADHVPRSKKGKNDRTDADAGNHCSFAQGDYKMRHLALHRIVRLCPSVCERHVGGRGNDPLLLPASGGSDGELGCGSSKRMRLS